MYENNLFNTLKQARVIYLKFLSFAVSLVLRDLKIRGRRREICILLTVAIIPNHVFKCGQTLPELNSLELYPSSESIGIENFVIVCLRPL